MSEHIFPFVLWDRSVYDRKYDSVIQSYNTTISAEYIDSVSICSADFLLYDGMARLNYTYDTILKANITMLEFYEIYA